MSHENSFKPQTAFEGYIKAQIESLFEQIKSTNGDIALFKSDVNDKFVGMDKRLNSIEGKISGIKGWIAGMAFGFGVLGGIVTVIVRGLI